MNKAQVRFSDLIKDPKLFLAFGFGSGLSPIVPGTMGTLAGVPLYLLMAKLPLVAFLAVIVVASVVGIYLCRYASRWLGSHDYKGIVWDEFVGLWITMIAVPFSWQTVLGGFLLFRFFDMLKPWPISVVDKHVHGGFGIMVDDMLAGGAACICLHILINYWPTFFGF